MIEILKTDSSHSDFQVLVKQLDAYLAEIDGEEHSFYHQYNKVDALKHVVVIYENNQPVGCGAFKELDSNTVEIKRMYVLPEQRGKGYATKILKALENWAAESEYQSCKLETGRRMPDAVAFYQSQGYAPIPNYGQYVGVENSVCFEKQLSQ
ncbi:GNAT family N-acetyltransferase [Fulvivirga lutea]|uniref:GNAT family N-acetyltransferase n=1 Tax=Fulvivirga lutea TaxID=2810512 RepID=A0A974WKH8_9BACT|nr:GNAT family N-acetyltransferase [Fulvivirga lutea]QSE98852.1 GNAT family N-acetyltransferase [Fulvivirga lutea]